MIGEMLVRFLSAFRKAFEIPILCTGLLLFCGDPAAPQDISVLADAARCKAQYLNPNLALEYCDRALRIPDRLPLDVFVETLFWRAFILVSKGEVDRAIEDANAAIKANPQSFFGHLAFAVAYYNKRDFQRAVIGYGNSI